MTFSNNFHSYLNDIEILFIFLRDYISEFIYKMKEYQYILILSISKVKLILFN